MEALVRSLVAALVLLALPVAAHAQRAPSVLLVGGNASADINLLGTYKLTLDADKNSYVYSSAGDTLDIYLGGASVAQLTSTVLTIPAALSLKWTGRSIISSSSDGVVLLTNNAGNAFTQLAFGGLTSSFPSLTRSGTTLQCTLADSSGTCQINAVRFLSGAASPTAAFAVSNGGNYGGASGSQYAWTSSATDGTATLDTGVARAAAGYVKLTDGSSGNAKGIIPGQVTFSALGTPSNGNIVYCSDCTIANPCASGGTGAIAKRLNGAWICN